MRFIIAFLLTGFVGFIVFQASSSATAQSINQIENPVVVESFTSQSCSSCPPADKLLGKLEKNDNVIALSCHVTYWNHLHWKDTLSREFCTQRQRQYTRSLKNRGPYTPQMVINGHIDVVGNRSMQVSNLVEKASKEERIIPLTFEKENKNIVVKLPTANLQNDTTLLLFSYINEHTQSIPSGENSGRTVSYTNPITEIENLGLWNGEAKTISLRRDKSTDGIALIGFEDRGYGKVIAAGKIEF